MTSEFFLAANKNINLQSHRYSIVYGMQYIHYFAVDLLSVDNVC